MMNTIIAELLGRMTPKEKAELCVGADDWHTIQPNQLKINAIRMGDGSNGLRIPYEKYPDQIGANASEPATCFPTESALAASWNPHLVSRVAAAIAEECRYRGVDILLAPSVNLKRSPLCGRNFEYFSEDPYLNAQLGCAYVSGVQDRGVGACLKHFAANSQEYHRMLSDNQVDLRALRELYLYAFEFIVKNSNPRAVMSAYNKINGEYAGENTFLLNDLLRNEWKFDGAVISDWFAVNDVAKSIESGLTLEMPADGGVGIQKIVDAIERGTLSEGDLDRTATESLALISKSNFAKSVFYLYDTDANHRLCEEAAEECIVLLKNKQNILPLQTNEKILVIGELASSPRFQGNGTSMVNPINTLNLLDAFGDYCESITYVKGYSLENGKTDQALLQEALSVAQSADKILILAGLPNHLESEGFDRSNLDLPANQNNLIRKISSVNSNTVVVLMNGAPVTMPWIDHVKGILETYLLGEGVARAIARILFGDRNPCGKLAESFPLSEKDIPSYRFYSERTTDPRNVFYKESIYVGYRYYQTAHKDVLFPFGYGLSYTSFAYRNLKLSSDTFNQDQSISVEVDIENIGDREGQEIVQLYVRDFNPRIFKPLSELKGFKKIALRPNESKTVRFRLNTDAFQFYDIQKESWNVYTGDYGLLIGASSEDIRLYDVIHVKGDDDYRSPYEPRELVSYHRFDSRIFTVPDMEFERLLGHKIKGNGEGHTLGLSATMGELRTGLWGKLFYRFAMRSARKKTVLEHALMLQNLPKSEQRRTKHKLFTPTDRMLERVTDEMPIKKIPFVTGGRIDDQMTAALLRIFAKEKGGWKQLRLAYRNHRKQKRRKP